MNGLIAMPEREEFRVPETVVRKRFLMFALVLPLWVVATPFFGIHTSLYSRLSTAVLFGVALLAVYFFSRKWVWVTVSIDGLSGHGPTWCKMKIGWDEAVEVKATKVSTMRGAVITRAADPGLFRKTVYSLFIPADIVVMPEFQAAVRRHASPSHPLRAIIDAAV